MEQIRELIDEVLFLSELESGTRVVSLGSVAVRPELDAVAAELEERASRAGVAVVVEGDPGVELAIRPRMIRVVAQNLAENAIRYAGPGATFTLAIERVGDAVVLRGTDDGVGVEEAQLGRLFERFFRADRARASRGTGLGLAIVKHVVTQAGGTVEALGGLGGGPRDPLHVLPCRVALGSPVSHQTFTWRRTHAAAGARGGHWRHDAGDWRRVADGHPVSPGSTRPRSASSRVGSTPAIAAARSSSTSRASRSPTAERWRSTACRSRSGRVGHGVHRPLGLR